MHSEVHTILLVVNKYSWAIGTCFMMYIVTLKSMGVTFQEQSYLGSTIVEFLIFFITISKLSSYISISCNWCNPIPSGV